MTALPSALKYAGEGWPIFPCRAGEEIHAETGEILTPKSPYTAYGFRSATTAPHVIKRWWDDWPDAMIGLPTGEPTGVWVLDVDVSDGKPGEESLSALIEQNGPLPETREARTASGGRHIYFAYHPGVRNRGALGAGLDVRGQGGFVIVPGSQLADGRRYEWINELQPAPAPDWLLALVVRKPEPPAATYTHRPCTGENVPYVDAAVSHELSALAATPQGQRNNALNDAAFSFGQFVGAGAMSRGDAEARLQAIASQWPNRRLSSGTIKRGLDAGQKHPRHIPEASHHEDDLDRWMPHKLLAKLRGKAEAVQTDAQPDAPPPPVSPVTATPFSWIDPSQLPRRDFVYGTHLVRKYVSVTVSPGGIGKSSLTIAEALAMVTGRPLLNTKPPRKLNVWLFNAEDPRDEMERRIMAAALHYKLKPDQLSGLFVDSGREQEIVVARDNKRGVVIQEPVVDAVIEQILRNKIDVMVIDPFVSTHAVSENDNGAIDRVAKLWSYIADVTNCAIEVVHHVRKSDGRDVTIEDARGAVSLLAAARSARVLNRMTAEQAAQANIPPEARYGYFSVSRGKANLSPMTGGEEWRRLVSEPLGNGAGPQRPQDHAGVVVEWQWPDKDALLETVTQDQIARICTEVDMADYRESEQAKDWVGHAVAFVLAMDMTDKNEKRRVKRLVSSWLDDGTFKIVEGRDPIRRISKKYVKSRNFEE